MRKIRKITIFLGILFALLFAGCTNKKDDISEKIDSDHQVEEERAQTEMREFASAETASEKIESEETETEEMPDEPSVFEIQIVEGDADRMYTEEGAVIYEFTSQEVRAEIPKYPNTANAIEDFFRIRNEQIHSQIDIENYYLYGSIEMDYHMGIEKQCANDKIISFIYGGDYFYGSGTMHNNTYYEGVVFDTVMGKRLQLADIVTDVSAFEKFVHSYIAIYMYNSYDSVIAGDYGYWREFDRADFECDINDNNWFFTDEGIMAICNPWEVASNATLVRTNVLIPYKELGDYLKPEYIPEQIEVTKSVQVADVDLYPLLYPGVTSAGAAQASGLDVKLIASAELAQCEEDIYYVEDGKICFTIFGSSPWMEGIEINQNIEGVSVAGCKIGMTYDECVQCLLSYGFKEKQLDYYYYSDNGRRMVNDTEWKYIDFLLINDVVVAMRYGVFENADEYAWGIYDAYDY